MPILLLLLLGGAVAVIASSSKKVASGASGRKTLPGSFMLNVSAIAAGNTPGAWYPDRTPPVDSKAAHTNGEGILAWLPINDNSSMPCYDSETSSPPYKNPDTCPLGTVFDTAGRYFWVYQIIVPAGHSGNRDFPAGDNRTWLKGYIEWRGFLYLPLPGAPEKEISFMDRALHWVSTEGAGLVLSVITVINPAVGLAAAVAYKAAYDLAGGAPLTNTVMDAALEYVRKEKGLTGARQQEDGLNAVRSGLSEAAIDTLRKSTYAKLAGDTSLMKMFESGVALGQTQRIQSVAITAVRNSLPAPDKAVMDKALMTYGTNFQDYMTAKYGLTDGLKRYQTIIHSATAKVVPNAAKKLGIS